MYSAMTWRMFDSLVRHYARADTTNPKPVTFREASNERLLQIAGVIDGLEDPRYRRSHILMNAGAGLPLANITSMTASTKTIVQSTVAWAAGDILVGIYQLLAQGPTDWGHFTARVLSVTGGNSYILEVLSGTMVDKAAVTHCRIDVNKAFTGSWDSSKIRLRNVSAAQDFPVSGQSRKRNWYAFKRFEVFREAHKDYALDGEIAFYNQGGTFEITAGQTAAAPAVPQLDFECTPATYREETENNTIELLPEHLRMLFDGVAHQVLTILNTRPPPDLKARMRDDLIRFYKARTEDIDRRAREATRVNE